MQFVSFVVLLAVAAGGVQAAGSLISPVNRVLGALKTLRTTIEAEGFQSQKYYDKFACRVKELTTSKQTDIDNGLEEIERLSQLILKLSGEIGTKTASVKNLEEDIKDNVEAQKEADTTRESERAAYLEQAKEGADTIGALQAALKVLSGTGTGGFLQQAQVMNVVKGVHALLAQTRALTSLSDAQLQELRAFMENPADSMNNRRATLSALQVSQQNNPFGDYAPRSDVIQGIMKQMLSEFNADLRKAVETETAAKTAYEKTSARRSAELKTLEANLESDKVKLAQVKVSIAESRESRSVTQHDVKEDKAFLAQLKFDAQERSAEHSDRCRLRAAELVAIENAINILDNPEAQRIFTNATSTTYPVSFLQTSRKSTLLSKQQQKKRELARQQSYNMLKTLATQVGSERVAKIAAKLQTTWHFDKVIKSCNEMMEILRAEEKADIEHRDRCQSAQNANENEMEDLNAEISTVDSEIKTLDGQVLVDIKANIGDVDVSIESLETAMAKLLEYRNEEHAVFQQAVSDDMEMISLLDKAIAALGKYYKDNKIELGLLQDRHRKQPVYAVDEDELPKMKQLADDNHAYDSANIISMLSMIREDSEKELQTTQADEAEAQASYEKERADLQANLDNKKALRATLMKEKAEADSALASANEKKTMKSADLDAETTLEETLKFDCTWVKDHFASRAEKRKAEMEGLTQAIAFLSGI
mmetsp:Transcript_62760/g.115413  ORF Transcript_62760/g.115413 Transcript_62760/m.115413 type:complete len:708 (-) Transcript_62760:79-2202(-)